MLKVDRVNNTPTINNNRISFKSTDSNRKLIMDDSSQKLLKPDFVLGEQSLLSLLGERISTMVDLLVNNRANAIKKELVEQANQNRWQTVGSYLDIKNA